MWQIVEDGGFYVRCNYGLDQ